MILSARKVHQGFTLIELIIVVGIISIISASIFVALNPTKRINDAKNTRIASDAAAIDKAIRLYIADTGEKPVTGTTTYEPAGGTVAICDAGIPTSSSCVNVDALVPQYLPALPDISNAPLQSTGFEYAYAPGGEYLTVIPSVIIISSASSSDSSSSASSVSSGSSESSNPPSSSSIASSIPSSSSLSSSSTVASSSSSINCNDLYSTDLVTEITHQIDSRVAGLPANTLTKNLFMLRGDDINAWERSSTVWTALGDAEIDMTGASPWNSQLAYKKAGTLISPRHMVYAYHYTIIPGSTIVFIDNDDNIVTRTLVSYVHVGAGDIAMGVLDADVPPSVAYYPVITYAQVAQYFSTTMRVPFLTLDFEDHAIIKDTFAISDVGKILSHMAPIVGTDRYAFHENLISGDSGNPAFYIINNQPVLILTHLSTGSGPFYGSHITELNQAMTTLGGGYQVTTVDLSCFDPI